MGAIKNWFGEIFEKVKRYFKGESQPSGTGTELPKIVIRGRNESVQSDNNGSTEIPHIEIRSINQRTPTASGTNATGSEVDVTHTDLGRGITVRRQHKPRICPECRTNGSIVDNPGDNPRWKCTDCGNTFN